MLVLTRHENEAIWVGDVRIVVTEISGNRCRLGIECDKSVLIEREEVRMERMERERKAKEAGQ
jgi:carbon storage regulator